MWLEPVAQSHPDLHVAGAVVRRGQLPWIVERGGHQASVAKLLRGQLGPVVGQHVPDM